MSGQTWLHQLWLLLELKFGKFAFFKYQCDLKCVDSRTTYLTYLYSQTYSWITSPYLQVFFFVFVYTPPFLKSLFLSWFISPYLKVVFFVLVYLLSIAKQVFTFWLYLFCIITVQ